jgi:hypothetical protein
MCTKWFSDGEVHKYFNPYSSPYEAFINYMNVLSDFTGRLDEYTASRKRFSRSEDRLLKASQADVAEDIWVSLANIPKIYLKKALKGVDARTLTAALYAAPNEIKERLVSCLGRRALNDYVSFRPADADLIPEFLESSRQGVLQLAKEAFISSN